MNTYLVHLNNYLLGSGGKITGLVKAKDSRQAKSKFLRHIKVSELDEENILTAKKVNPSKKSFRLYDEADSMTRRFNSPGLGSETEIELLRVEGDPSYLKTLNRPKGQSRAFYDM